MLAARAEQDTAGRYPVGTRIRYADSGTVAVESGPETVSLAVGVVNGPPVSDGTRVFVPAFTSRDKDREATTVYVDQRNIVEKVDGW